MKNHELIPQAVLELDAKRNELAKERRRMLNTRHSILCSRCKNPLASSSDAVHSGMTNLGLRTAGDGQVRMGYYNKFINDYKRI
jgi:hypothetical protein